MSDLLFFLYIFASCAVVTAIHIHIDRSDGD